MTSRQHPAQAMATDAGVADALVAALAGARACARPQGRAASFLQRLSGADGAAFRALAVRGSWPAGSSLLLPGDDASPVIAIERGCAAVYAYSPRGRRISALAGAGDLLGVPPAPAVALRGVEALVVPHSRWRRLVASRPGIAGALADALTERLASSAAVGSRLDARARVGAGLLELALRFGVPGPDGIRIDVPLTQRELAQLFGVSLPALRLTLRALRAEGALRTGRRSVTITAARVLRADASANPAGHPE